MSDFVSMLVLSTSALSSPSSSVSVIYLEIVLFVLGHYKMQLQFATDNVFTEYFT